MPVRFPSIPSSPADDQETKISPVTAVLLAVIVLVLGAVGSTCALSNSAMADVQIAGKTFFDLFDYLSSNILMPLGGIFLCLFVGWVWGEEKMRDALTNGGELVLPILKPLFFIIRYVSPLLILIVMLKGLGLF